MCGAEISDSTTVPLATAVGVVCKNTVNSLSCFSLDHDTDFLAHASNASYI